MTDAEITLKLLGMLILTMSTYYLIKEIISFVLYLIKRII